jgi:hypothetical protein
MRKSNFQRNFDRPPFPELGKNSFGSDPIYYCLCKKEFGSDTPKWVFHRGGGIHPHLSHPEISDGGSNRVNILNVKERKKWSYFLCISDMLRV